MQTDTQPADAPAAPAEPKSEIAHLASMRKEMFAHLNIPMPVYTDTQRLDRLLKCLIDGDPVLTTYLEKFNHLPKDVEEARECLDFALAAVDALK